MFELEAVRTWERNPQFYSDLLASSLAGQTLFSHAPGIRSARRRVLSKLRQTPRPDPGGPRQHQDPPGIFVKVGIETMRGALKFIEDELPRAFADVDDLHLLGDLADAQTEASQAVGSLCPVPREPSVAPKARALVPARTRASSSRSCGSTKASCDAGRSAARHRDARAESDAGSLQGARRTDERRRSAGSVGAHEGASIRRPASSSPVGREQLDELATFLERQSIDHAAARRERSPSRPTPDFYRLVVCQHVDARAVRDQADARLLLPDRRRSARGRRRRQDEHLRDYNYPTLWSISIHEVYPGHFLHYQHLRRVESKARKSIMFAPASFVEGWAHYCEQMMIEAGFGRQDHGIKLGQLAEALIRLARFIVCIKLHAEDMSVEQGVRFFRDEAFMEEASARARGRARDLRSDLSGLQRRQADAAQAAPGLQAAAGQVVFAAVVPRHAARSGHRALLAASPTDARRRGRPARLTAPGPTTKDHAVMPLYEYECDACGHRFEKILKFSDPLNRHVPELRRRRCTSSCRRPRFISKATGWYITDYAKKDQDTTETKDTKDTKDTKEAKEAEKSEKREKAKKQGLEKDSSTEETHRREKLGHVVVVRRHHPPRQRRDSSRVKCRLQPDQRSTALPASACRSSDTR